MDNRMNAHFSNDEIQVFRYPWNYLDSYALMGIIFLVAVLVIFFQKKSWVGREAIASAIVLTIGLTFVAFCIVQQIRILREPYRITTRPDGLYAEGSFGGSVFIPWESIVSMEELEPRLYERSVVQSFNKILKISTESGTSLIIRGQITGFEQLKGKIEERVKTLGKKK